MNHINNQARFSQKSDFSQVTLWGSDIDFFSEIAGKCYILVEWKTEGTGLPHAQELAFRRFVQDMGQVKPVFCVIAEHDTHPSEAITGHNSLVKRVRYRLPSMHTSDEYLYEDETPTLNQWLSDCALELRFKNSIFRGVPEFWEGFPVMLCSEEEAYAYEYIEDIPKKPAPSAFFDHIRPVLEGA
jgi:hypothetical protein